MKKIDKEHIEHPAKGVVGMTDFLLENNFRVGLRRVRRLMRQMGRLVTRPPAGLSTDRGCQYCSDAYVSELKKHGVSISMTQSGNPLENAIAERANGILKSEWLYKMTIPTREVCKLELCRIIDFYNTQRPHMSIGWQTPEQAHNQCGEQQRCWKNYCRQAVASEDPQLGVYAPGLSRLTEETLTEEVAV